MRSDEISRARAELGFRETAEEAFEFLVRDCGFQLLDSEATIVRYATERVFLHVYHGRSSYELGVEVGPLGSEDRGYSLEEFVRLSDPNAAVGYRTFIATTLEEIHAGLAQLTEQVKRHVMPALSGKPDVFADLMRQRKAWSEAYAGEVLAGQTRPKAEQAFREHDYARVVELFSEIEDKLSPAEKHKLEYARRRIAH